MSWDDDLQFGERGELILGDFLRGAGFSVSPYQDGHQKEADLVVNDTLVEVKLDRLSAQTGNIAIEYLFKGQKSGISATRAEIFCYITDTVYCFQTTKLKEWLRANWKYLKKTKGGDDNQSHLVLVRLSDIRNISYCVFDSPAGARNFLCIAVDKGNLT